MELWTLGTTGSSLVSALGEVPDGCTQFSVEGGAFGCWGLKRELDGMQCTLRYQQRGFDAEQGMPTLLEDHVITTVNGPCPPYTIADSQVIALDEGSAVLLRRPLQAVGQNTGLTLLANGVEHEVWPNSTVFELRGASFAKGEQRHLIAYQVDEPGVRHMLIHSFFPDGSLAIEGIVLDAYTNDSQLLGVVHGAGFFVVAVLEPDAEFWRIAWYPVDELTGLASAPHYSTLPWRVDGVVAPSFHARLDNGPQAVFGVGTQSGDSPSKLLFALTPEPHELNLESLGLPIEDLRIAGDGEGYLLVLGVSPNAQTMLAFDAGGELLSASSLGLQSVAQPYVAALSSSLERVQALIVEDDRLWFSSATCF
ncbi:MAG: hypothetical protein RBU37_17315, partial [Myxococcota bacterium]|jgi:hypothetical protein|nr:hypothetical protein [Myxococcota bacterium]